MDYRKNGKRLEGLDFEFREERKFPLAAIVLLASTLVIFLAGSFVLYRQQQQIIQQTIYLELHEDRIQNLEKILFYLHSQEIPDEPVNVPVNSAADLPIRRRKKRQLQVRLAPGRRTDPIDFSVRVQEGDPIDQETSHFQPTGRGSEPEYHDTYWESTSAPFEHTDENGVTYKNFSKRVYSERTFTGDSQGIHNLLGSLGLNGGQTGGAASSLGGSSSSSSGSSRRAGFVAFGTGCNLPKPCAASHGGVGSSSSSSIASGSGSSVHQTSYHQSGEAGESSSRELSIGGRQRGGSDGVPAWGTMMQIPSGTYRSSYQGSSNSGTGRTVESSSYDNPSSTRQEGSYAGSYDYTRNSGSQQLYTAATREPETTTTPTSIYDNPYSSSSYSSGSSQSQHRQTEGDYSQRREQHRRVHSTYHQGRQGSGSYDYTSGNGNSYHSSNYNTQPPISTYPTTTTTPPTTTDYYQSRAYELEREQRRNYNYRISQTRESEYDRSGYDNPTYPTTSSHQGVDVSSSFHQRTYTDNGARSGAVVSEQCKKYAPIAGHFVGEGTAAISSDGAFQNWRKSSWMDGEDDNFILSRSGIVAVRKTGFYYLYAQIHYELDGTLQGYMVQVNGSPIFECSVLAPEEVSEIVGTRPTTSCNTGGLQFLRANDQVAIKSTTQSQSSDVVFVKSFFGLINIVGNPLVAENRCN